MIRSLGERRAHLVGHATGGTLAWVAAVMRPSVIQSLTAVSAAHPRDLRRALLTDRRQLAAFEHVLSFQRPWIPERRLVADDAAQVGRYLDAWTGPNRLEPAAVDAYRQAMQIPSTAHCSIEPYRWLMRSMARPDGIQFARRMKKPITAPTLHIQGAADPVLLSHTALGGRVRVGPLPVAAAAGCRALPARGGTGAVLGGADRLDRAAQELRSRGAGTGRPGARTGHRDRDPRAPGRRDRDAGTPGQGRRDLNIGRIGLI